MKCVIVKKMKFIKEQESSGLLSSFRTKYIQIKFLCLVLFCFKSIQQVKTRYKMNEIVNRFLLVGDKFMPEMPLRQPRFTYSDCGPFTKNKQRIKKILRKRRFKIYLLKRNR